jgi:hypothetical protein
MLLCARVACLQGEEATVVILSLVRSRDDGNIGFLRLQVGPRSSLDVVAATLSS